MQLGLKNGLSIFGCRFSNFLVYRSSAIFFAGTFRLRLLQDDFGLGQLCL
jgi:hypothetical protein